jgi:aldose 1-epimerase
MRSLLLNTLALLFASLPPIFGQYSTVKDSDVVRLEDKKHQTIVSVMPSRGNVAFDMTVKGKKVLRYPFASVDEFRKSRGMIGIPFLGPWANRLDEPAFYANGKKYPFNLTLGNVRPNQANIPIHGFLTNAPQWEVTDARADGSAAWVTSRLEFYRQPDWMAQFPFAHTIEMTYRLQDGVLEVATRLHNLAAEPMPLAIGFHPYFQVNDAPRDEWTFGIAARTEWTLTKDNVPTGETRPIEQLLPKPQGGTLKGVALDHVFADLVRNAAGQAVMWVQGKSERIDVLFGPNYRAVVVYSPGGPNRDFICFEPMTGITNALNLAHRGVYKELQYVKPGQTWQESFWVRPTGY